MIVVPVKEGESIDRALKRLKRKFEKTGVVRELRARQKFTKPSVIKREQSVKQSMFSACYQNKLINSITKLGKTGNAIAFLPFTINISHESH